MPAWLTDLFARYGYFVVFFGILLENAGVPVPGETILLAGAALARFGHLSLLWVISTAIAGAVLGDNVGFLIGRRGGRRLLERHGGMLGLTKARLDQFDAFFARHGAKTVFIARFVTGLRVVGAVLAGGSGIPWRIFLVYNASGALAWCVAVSVAGYALGRSWELLVTWIGRLGIAALALAAGLTVAWFVRDSRRQKR